MIAKLRTARPRRLITENEFRRMVAANIFAAGEPVAYADGDVYLDLPEEGLTPYRFSVEQYHRMIDIALLGEDERVELIRGEIVYNMPIGDPHMACVKRLAKFLGARYEHLAHMSTGDPIRLADSEPQPDFMLLVPKNDFYLSGKPVPADAYLIVEVADSSFEHDRDDKAPLYAENGVGEYWIVELNAETVHVYRDPQPGGTYSSIQQFTRGATLTIAALPGVSVAVADILP
jgi:Uma2 family endonuclease